MGVDFKLRVFLKLKSPECLGLVVAFWGSVSCHVVLKVPCLEPRIADAKKCLICVLRNLKCHL